MLGKANIFLNCSINMFQNFPFFPPEIPLYSESQIFLSGPGAPLNSYTKITSHVSSSTNIY